MSQLSSSSRENNVAFDDTDDDYPSRTTTPQSPSYSPTPDRLNVSTPQPHVHHSPLPTAQVPPTIHTPNGFVETPLRTFAEERMRRKLQFFFMNPIEKWQTRRRFPYKFLVQVIKLVIVSMQLCLFAHSRYNHVNYTWDNRVTFSHLFLKGWDATEEVESYPPSIGPMALYVQDEFFETIDHAVNGYANVNISIGPYSYPTDDNSMAPLKLCLYQYKQGIIFGFNESYVFNPEIERICVNLTGNVTKVGSREYLAGLDVIVNFESLVKATLDFSLKTVNFKVINILLRLIV